MNDKTINTVSIGINISPEYVRKLIESFKKLMRTLSEKIQKLIELFKIHSIQKPTGIDKYKQVTKFIDVKRRAIYRSYVEPKLDKRLKVNLIRNHC